MKRWSDPSQHCFARVQGIKLRFLWNLLKMGEAFGAAIGSVRPRFWQMCFPGHRTASPSERSACRSRRQSGRFRTGRAAASAAGLRRPLVVGWRRAGMGTVGRRVRAKRIPLSSLQMYGREDRDQPKRSERAAAWIRLGINRLSVTSRLRSRGPSIAATPPPVPHRT